MEARNFDGLNPFNIDLNKLDIKEINNLLKILNGMFNNSNSNNSKSMDFTNKSLSAILSKDFLNWIDKQTPEIQKEFIGHIMDIMREEVECRKSQNEYIKEVTKNEKSKGFFNMVFYIIGVAIIVIPIIKKDR